MDDSNRSQAQKLSHAKPGLRDPDPTGKPRPGPLDEGQSVLNTQAGGADYRVGREGRDALAGKINEIVTLSGTRVKKGTLSCFLW